MKQSLVWRGVLIAVIVAGAVLSAYPLKEKIKLGLDLKGGMHLVLEVQTPEALKAETENAIARLIEEASDEGISNLRTEQTGETAFAVTGLSSDDLGKVRDFADDAIPGWSDSRSGERLTFEMSAAEADQIENLSVVQAEETIRNRVDAFGVAEPVIARLLGGEGNRIVVQLPGVDNPEKIRELIGKVALLDFRLVEYPASGGSAASREEILANYGGTLPDDIVIYEQPIRDEVTGAKIGTRYYGLQKRRVITGRDLRNARPSLGQFNDPIVLFDLHREAGERFGEFTGTHVGRAMAIVLDNRVVSAPRINSRINDRGQIEGGFTQDEVELLSTQLRSGALPAPMTFLEERTVGPSLGRDSIRKGIRAGLLGGLLVICSMLVVYRMTGINAVTALVLNVVLVFGALASVGATLTLPGIAGIILVIGMAVDANVLVFERIREELHLGRTVKSAVDAGFRKALSSVLDANITTLIASLFLFQFGTGPIRGFAVTLSIGILASVFTAIFVSRWLFDFHLSRSGRVERLSI